MLCVQDDNQIANPKDLPYIFVCKFDDESVTAFYKSFLEMLADNKIKIIPVVVSSFGGQVHSLLSMLDIIEASPKPVATIGLGKAMSCGSVLLAYGTKGYRYAAPNTDIMIHEVSSMTWGKNSDLKNDSKHTDELNKKLFELLESKGNMKKGYLLKEMRKRVNVDWFLSASQYKTLGLVDHVAVPTFLKK